MDRAINFCKDVDRANEAITLQEKMENIVESFDKEEKKIPALFSKEVSFLVRASHGHDHGFSDLSIERLEIRPNLDSPNSKLFCFSLILVLAAKNGETFQFRIARTNNYARFYVVQCKDNGVFTIQTGDDVCVRFISGNDFMETLNFCYDAIDEFNEKLDVKLKGHLQYFCQTPLVRVRKDSLSPVDYFVPGIKVGIFDGENEINQAVIVSIEDTSTTYYSISKKMTVKYFSDISLDKTHRFGFIAEGETQKEGWYMIDAEGSYNNDGPAYEIKPV